MLDETKITTRQLVLFAVVLSFITSVIGTILALGVLGPVFGFGEDNIAPFVFNRPKILQQIIGTEKKTLSHEELVIKAVQDSSPAVVSIVASKDVPVVEKYYVDPFNDPFFQQFFGNGGSGVQVPQYRQKGTERKEVSSGSGFIVSPDGMIVTNKHVVSDTEAAYTVLLNDGSKKPAKILARDPIHDLAILKIEAAKLPVVRLGNSSTVTIGQTAIVIGNALGEFRNTVSVGVISGLHRSVVADGSSSGPESLEQLIQTDAAINPGNSGGALVDVNGNLLGINSAIYSPNGGSLGIGFAVPANIAKRTMEQIIQSGSVTRGWIGTGVQELTPELAESFRTGNTEGVLVTEVIRNSPAEQAGIKTGDIVMAIDDKAINGWSNMLETVSNITPGKVITVKLMRNGAVVSLPVKVGKRPKPKTQ